MKNERESMKPYFPWGQEHDSQLVHTICDCEGEYDCLPTTNKQHFYFGISPCLPYI